MDCPKCGDPLGELDPEGLLVAVCPRCRFRYRFVAGPVRRWASRPTTPRPQAGRQPPAWERRCELRLERADGELELVRFTTPGPDEEVELPAGDQALVVSTLRRAAVEEIVALVNLTTGERFPLTTPGARAARRVRAGAAVVGLGGWGLAWGLVGLGPLAAALTGGAAAWVGLLVGQALLGLRVPLDPTARAEIARRQELLRRKRALEVALSRARREAAAHRRLAARLAALRDKMASVGPDLYGARLETVERALALVDRQRALDARLVREHERAITILEIEHEAARATDALEGEVLGGALARLDALREVEAESAALTEALLADEEVARLVR